MVGNVQEKAAEIILRQMEKLENAFEAFMKEKEEKDRPDYAKELLVPQVCLLADALAKLQF